MTFAHPDPRDSTAEPLDLVRQALQRLSLGGKRLLVGVSGGADSVFLLRALSALKAEFETPLCAAHLNHGLRAAAEADAAWTQALCARLQVPFTLGRVDVRQRAELEGEGLEEAARKARYEFFEETARSAACACVAVAHTADDRVETVLHHMLRGTGPAGLVGIRESRPLAPGILLVRPLLKVGRPAIERWLGELGQDFRTDETNADLRHTRNRIRQTVLPGLERDFGPHVRESLLRLADQALEMQEAIEELAGRLLDQSLQDDSSDACRLDCRPLADQPAHLVREVFVTLWKRKGWPRKSLGFDDWDRLCRLAEQSEGRMILSGKIEAIRRGTLLVLRRGEAEQAPKAAGG